MEKVRQFLYARPRLFAALLLLGGIGVSIHLVAVYHAGDSVFTKDFTYAPVLLAYGLGALIEPRIVAAWLPNNQRPGAALFKALSIMLIVLGLGVGLYLEYVVFKDWKPASLTDTRSVEETLFERGIGESERKNTTSFTLKMSGGESLFARL